MLQCFPPSRLRALEPNKADTAGNVQQWSPWDKETKITKESDKKLKSPSGDEALMLCSHCSRLPLPGKHQHCPNEWEEEQRCLGKMCRSHGRHEEKSYSLHANQLLSYKQDDKNKSNEAGDEATAKFNFHTVKLPKCCQMVTQIKSAAL